MRVHLFLLVLLISAFGLAGHSEAAETGSSNLEVRIVVGEDPPDGAQIQIRTPDRSRVITEWTYEMGDDDEVFRAILPPGQYNLQSRPLLAMTPAGSVVHPEPYNLQLDTECCDGTIEVDVVLTHGQARFEDGPESHHETPDTTTPLKPTQGSVEPPEPDRLYGTMILRVAGLVSTWGAWRARGRLIPLLPLWARRTPSRNGETARARILDEIRHNPGITRESLRKILGFAEGRLQHHLQVLSANGRIAEVRRARMRCFFIPGTLPLEETVRLAVLTRPGAKKVHEAVREHPGASISEIARAIDLSPSRVSRLTARLENDDLLITRWSNGRRRLYPKDL